MKAGVDDFLAAHGADAFLMSAVIAVMHIELNLGLAELAYTVAGHPR